MNQHDEFCHEKLQKEIKLSSGILTDCFRNTFSGQIKIGKCNRTCKEIRTTRKRSILVTQD